MPLLYNDAPTVSYSLTEFTDFATGLYQAQEYDAFIRFVITGEYTDPDGNREQAFVDPIRGPVDPEHPLTISRDYDSLIGISSDILVDGQLSVYPVPHPTFALKTSLHMKHTIIYDEVSLKRIISRTAAYCDRRSRTRLNFTTFRTSNLETSVRDITSTSSSRNSGLPNVLNPPVHIS